MEEKVVPKTGLILIERNGPTTERKRQREKRGWGGGRGLGGERERERERERRPRCGVAVGWQYALDAVLYAVLYAVQQGVAHGACSGFFCACRRAGLSPHHLRDAPVMSVAYAHCSDVGHSCACRDTQGGANRAACARF